MFVGWRNSNEVAMSDYLWTGIVAFGLMIYLLYALIKPEKF